MNVTLTVSRVTDRHGLSWLHWQEATLPNQCARPLSGSVAMDTEVAHHIAALATENARLKHAVLQAGFHCAGVDKVDAVSHRCLAVLRGEWFDNVTARD